MYQDKLTHDERIRLEALALVVPHVTEPTDADEIVKSAATFEFYIKNGNEEPLG